MAREAILRRKRNIGKRNKSSPVNIKLVFVIQYVQTFANFVSYKISHTIDGPSNLFNE